MKVSIELSASELVMLYLVYGNKDAAAIIFSASAQESAFNAKMKRKKNATLETKVTS